MTTTAPAPVPVPTVRLLATIELSRTRLAIASRHNPAVLDVVDGSIREANRLLAFAAETIEVQHQAGLHRGNPEAACEDCAADLAVLQEEMALEDEAYARNTTENAQQAAA